MSLSIVSLCEIDMENVGREKDEENAWEQHPKIIKDENCSHLGRLYTE